MVLNGINHAKHLTDEEMAVVEAMREEGANPYECIEALEERVEALEERVEALEERVEVLEDIVKDIAYAHDNIKALQTDISGYIRKMLAENPDALTKKQKDELKNVVERLKMVNVH